MRQVRARRVGCPDDDGAGARSKEQS